MGKGIAVIVESRAIPNIKEVVENHMKYSGFPVMFFHGAGNKDFIEKELDGMDVELVNMGIYELTEGGYNSLLTSKWFWNRLPAGKILIFQHDSRLLRHGIDDFLEDGADYYGAPFWFMPHGGNGGLSLRSKSAMLKVIEQHPYLGIGLSGNEDVFFCNKMSSVGARLGSPEMCAKFSCESVFAMGTYGYHAIEKWLTPEQCEQIKNQYAHSKIQNK